jgi:hypothetical protein
MTDLWFPPLLPSNDAKEMLGLWAEPFEAFQRLAPNE